MVSGRGPCRHFILLCATYTEMTHLCDTEGARFKMTTRVGSAQGAGREGWAIFRALSHVMA